MALSIKDPKTERLARNLAQLTGESITTATRTRHRGAIAPGRRSIPSGCPVGGDGRNPPSLECNAGRGRPDARRDSRHMTSMDCRADGDRHICDRGDRARRASCSGA